MEMNGINESVFFGVRKIVLEEVTSKSEYLRKCDEKFDGQVTKGVTYLFIDKLAEYMGKTRRQLTGLDIKDNKYKDQITKEMVDLFIGDEMEQVALEVDDLDNKLTNVFSKDLVSLAEYILIINGLAEHMNKKYTSKTQYDNVMNSLIRSFLTEVMNDPNTKLNTIVIRMIEHAQGYCRRKINRAASKEEESDEIG